MYLLKILITYCKKQIPLSNVLIDCISAKSKPQVLCIKDKCNFRSSIFPIIRLYNSFANSFFYTISLYIARPANVFPVIRVVLDKSLKSP